MNLQNKKLILGILKKLGVHENQLIKSFGEYDIKNIKSPSINESIYIAHDIVLTNFKNATIEYQDVNKINVFSCASEIDIPIKDKTYDYGFDNRFNNFNFRDKSDQNINSFLELYGNAMGKTNLCYGFAREQIEELCSQKLDAPLEDFIDFIDYNLNLLSEFNYTLGMIQGYKKALNIEEQSLGNKIDKILVLMQEKVEDWLK